MTFCRNTLCSHNSDTKDKKQDLGSGAAGQCTKNDIILDLAGVCMSREEQKIKKEG
jgi:hypothetical protein